MSADKGDSTVLLVIDENHVRKIAKSTLEKAGFRVVALSSAEVSYDFVRDNVAGLQLAVVDADMAGGDPYGFLKMIRQVAPGLRVLLLSGDIESTLINACSAQKPCWTMRKPYRRAQLLGHVIKAANEPLVLSA
jgi:two-component system C4-dicarboxylate transport response regulator DctD